MRSRASRDAQFRQADYEDMLAAAAAAQAVGGSPAPAPQPVSMEGPVWTGQDITVDNGSGTQIPWYTSPAAMGDGAASVPTGSGLGNLAGFLGDPKRKRR
jgi:hypothetical protein